MKAFLFSGLPMADPAECLGYIFSQPPNELIYFCAVILN